MPIAGQCLAVGFTKNMYTHFCIVILSIIAACGVTDRAAEFVYNVIDIDNYIVIAACGVTDRAADI